MLNTLIVLHLHSKLPNVLFSVYIQLRLSTLRIVAYLILLLISQSPPPLHLRTPLRSLSSII